MLNENLNKDQKGENTEEYVNSPTVLSRKLTDLKKATLHAVNSRERLPQPLFWSLFSSELADIKAARQEQRILRKILYGIDF